MSFFQAFSDKAWLKKPSCHRNGDLAAGIIAEVGLNSFQEVLRWVEQRG
jgi:hypothetical protein